MTGPSSLTKKDSCSYVKIDVQMNHGKYDLFVVLLCNIFFSFFPFKGENEDDSTEQNGLLEQTKYSRNQEFHSTLVKSVILI